MTLAHTPASRSAGHVTMLLAIVQLFLAYRGDHDSYIEALLLAQAAATVAGAVKLLRDSSVESRLGVGFLAALSGLGALVPATLGLPGHERTWGVLPAVVFLLSVVVIALLMAEQPRRVAERRSRSPYAS